MAVWKRSGPAAAAASHQLRRLPGIAWIALGWGAAAIYAFLFFRLPIAETVTLDGVAVSRAAFVVGSLLYPEGFIEAWFDSGMLPAGFLDRLPIAIGTALWLGLATAIGLPLVQRATGRARGWAAQTERFAAAALVGLALLSTVSLLVGLAGGLHSRVHLMVAIGSLAALAYGLGWFGRGRQMSGDENAASAVARPWPAQTQTRGLFDHACVMFAVALACWSAVVTMLGAWVPASEFDVVEYHLQAPKEFFELGEIRFLPHNVYANMPLGTEMHTLAMMTLVGQPDPWLGGLIGKSITAAFSLIGAAFLGAYLTRRCGALCGWWGAGLWLATPGIAHVAMLGLIDGVLATYVLAAALCVTRGIELLGRQPDGRAQLDENATQWRPRGAAEWWGLAGVMAGAAAAVKYPGLIFAVVPVGAALALAIVASCWPRRTSHRPAVIGLRGRERWLALGLFACGLIATCVPWYAKNWIQAGNPVYPLAAGLFGGKTLTPAKVAQWQQAHRVPPSAPPQAGAVAYLVGSVRVALRDLGRLLLTSAYVQPALVCGLCIGIGAWFGRRIAPNTSFAVWLCWSIWIVGVWWLATHRIDRFWLPLTGLWAALAALGLGWLRSRGAPWLAHAIVIVGLVYGSLINSSALISDNRFFVSLAALRDDATTDQRVGRLPAEQAWINEHLSTSESRVLLIGEARAFEYRVPVLYSTCFDLNPGEAVMRGKSPAEQAAALHAQGITHIMINWGEIARYRSPGNYGFSDWPQPADIEQLIANGIASRVDWPFRHDAVELLKVE